MKGPSHERFGVALQRMRLRLAGARARFAPLLEDVAGWVDARGLGPDDPIAYAFEGGYAVLARLRWAQGRARESARLLDRLIEVARSEGRVRDVVAYLAQRALAERRLRAPDRARATLQAALDLAEPRGYVRTFVDLGRPMRSSLEGVRDGGTYVAGLIDAFAGAPTELASVAPATVALPAATHHDLGEREVAILRLLAAGRPNKGIAKDLGLSPNTVKWYLTGLFEKLGVNGRAQAVGRAKDLGLL